MWLAIVVLRRPTNSGTVKRARDLARPDRYLQSALIYTQRGGLLAREAAPADSRSRPRRYVRHMHSWLAWNRPSVPCVSIYVPGLASILPLEIVRGEIKRQYALFLRA